MELRAWRSLLFASGCLTLSHLCVTGIQQLQLMLLKIALIVAVEFHINVEFVKLLEPPEDQEKEGNWWPVHS